MKRMILVLVFGLAVLGQGKAQAGRVQFKTDSPIKDVTICMGQISGI